MNILETIADATEEGYIWKKRLAVRAILFDDRGLVPIIFMGKLRYHKLPGGGVKQKEDILDALRREVLEEVGCAIEIQEEIGSVIERRLRHRVIQTSYCFTGRIISKGMPDLTKGERWARATTHWMSLDEAIATMESEHPTSYEGKFINKRELVYLRHAREL